VIIPPLVFPSLHILSTAANVPLLKKLMDNDLAYCGRHRQRQPHCGGCKDVRGKKQIEISFNWVQRRTPTPRVGGVGCGVHNFGYKKLN